MIEALTGALTTPLDVIKTRLMVKGSANPYKGIVDCVQTIVREEGLVGPRAVLRKSSGGFDAAISHPRDISTILAAEVSAM